MVESSTEKIAHAAAEVTGPAAPATVAASAVVSDAVPKPTATVQKYHLVTAA
jgi:hypothetical protein